MFRTIKAFFLLLLFSFLFEGNASAQVLTGIGDVRICSGAFGAVPVTVQNLTGTGHFSLELNFDENAVEYVSYFALHQQLKGGTFAISSGLNSITINWQEGTVANIINDTLVWLTFKGKAGQTALTWNSATSLYYTDSTNTLPASFVNGSAQVSPKLGLLLSEIDATCASACSANYVASGIGGVRPHQYTWNGKPGRFDSIQTGLCSGSNVVVIKDAWGCEFDSLFTITGLPGASVKLKMEKDSVIYLQNPVISFSFDEIPPTHVVEPPLWEFGDGDTSRSFNPTHVFDKAITNTDNYYLLKLHIKNENGCDTLIEQRIPIREAKLIIPNVMTPNADDVNDVFGIANYEKQQAGAHGKDALVRNEFERMEVFIFDRWGRKIFDASNYQNDWSASGVPDGVYYYVLKTIGFYKTDKYKGSITILGSGLRP